MSEKSLDDFFAKKAKGKKGKKSKGKFTTTDEIAKNLTTDPAEQPRKTTKKLEKEKKDEVDSDKTKGLTDGSTAELTEEWNEIEEKETDYSDLKIQALQISEESKQEQEEGEEEELDENGEPIKSKGQGSTGPWNKMQAPEPATIVDEVPQEPTPKQETPNVVSGKYIPPSKRAQMSAANNQSSYNARLKARGRPNVAPQITSEQEFPTLAASSDILKYSDKRDERTFETVTKGGINSDGAARAGRPKLNLDNRFSALGQ